MNYTLNLIFIGYDIYSLHLQKLSTFNRSFVHSRFDSKIMFLHLFFIRVISLYMTGKMAPVLARTMEETTNLTTIFSKFVDI